MSDDTWIKSSVLASESEGGLNCYICMKEVTGPILLPCYHSFCSKCLLKGKPETFDSQSIDCPLCSWSDNIPDNTGDSEYFRKDIYRETAMIKTEKSENICQDCEKYLPVPFYCLDCQAGYCALCNDKHLRTQYTLSHRVAETSAVTDLNNHLLTKRYCVRHNTDECRLYCVECDQVLCISCKAIGHEEHLTKEINDVSVDAREEVCRCVSEAKSYVPSRLKDIEGVSGVKTKSKETMSELLIEINCRASVMHSMIEKVREQLCERVAVHSTNMEEELARAIDDSVKRSQSLAGLVDTAEVILTTADDISIIQERQSIIARLKSVNEEKKSIQPKENVQLIFVSGTNDEKSLEKLFGQLSSNVDETRNNSVLLSSMEFGNAKSTATSIAPSTEGDRAWVNVDGEIHLFTKNGLDERQVDIGGSMADDVTLDSRGNLLVSCPMDKYVKLVTPNREVTKLCKIRLIPTGIATTSQNEVVVCSVEKTLERYKPNNKCSIDLFSSTGKYENNISGISAFKFPYRVAVTTIGELIVTDPVSRKVVVMTSDGDVISVFNGEESAAATFIPSGVCVDRFRNIIVTDVASHTVHLLDPAGGHLRQLLTDHDGVEKPFSVALDTCHHLWIGLFESGNIKVFLYTAESIKRYKT